MVSAKKKRQKKVKHKKKQGGGPAVGIMCSPAKEVESAKPGPDNSAAQKEKHNQEILLGLKRALANWKGKGWDIGSGKDEAMERIVSLIKELSDVDSLLRGKTALIMCAEAGCLNGVLRLEERYADPTITDSVGKGARELAHEAGHHDIGNHIAGMVNEWNAIAELHIEGGIRNTEKRAVFALLELAVSGQMSWKKWMKKFERFEDKNTLSEDGVTALMVAVDGRHLNLVEAILNTQGVDVNAVGEDGRTALGHAEDLNYVPYTGDKRHHIIDVFKERGAETKG